MCSRNLAIKEGFINYYDELNKLKVKRQVSGIYQKRKRFLEFKQIFVYLGENNYFFPMNYIHFCSKSNLCLYQSKTEKLGYLNMWLESNSKPSWKKNPWKIMRKKLCHNSIRN